MTEYQREKIFDCLPEMKPLFDEHYDEIEKFKDIKFDPDLTKYKALEDLGFLYLFTARVDSKLVGYALFFVDLNLHYKNSVQAHQDAMFVRSDFRGKTGYNLIKFCDEELKKVGVQVVYHHVKAEHDFGKLLERIGYKLSYKLFAKRLDK